MEAAEGSAVAFRVLGPVEAWRDGSVVRLGGPRQRALLALLLLESGRSVTADRLIDELWAGEPTDGAETTLRTYVSRLRATLGHDVPITATAAGYALTIDPDHVDARRFEGLVHRGEAALARRNPRQARELLSEALGLWGGSPYGELAADGALRVEAERLAELRLRAIERRLEAELGLGLGAELVEEVEAAVGQHPFRERLWHHLMLALYRAGRQADALTAYQRARTLFDEELGLEPSEELQRLQLAILRHEVPDIAPPEQRHNLPASLTTFVGRTNDLARVKELLEANRLVTLVGVGGVGKTRLALEVAGRAIGDYPDGVFFVDFAPVADPELVPPVVGAALEIREQAGVAPTDRLVRNLRAMELLLVLDNCEHVREATAQLASRLLAAAPGLRILATSREVLGVPGETALAVPPLDLPRDPDDADGIRRSGAVALFMARAREVLPALADDDATLETVARICRELDGLPLGIELAAARSRALSPREIADRLSDRFRFLVAWRRLTTARHRTLREAMDWSYDLLGPEEQRLLRGLSVFAGGFNLEAVGAVCTNGHETQALDLMERLVEASLVTVDAGRSPTRYRVLETVRQYGAERLAEASEVDDAQRRHATYFTRFAVDAWGPLRGIGAQQEWVVRAGDDRDNVRAALAWSRDSQEHDNVLRIAESMWWFWWIRGDLTEARTWLEIALERSAASEPILRARALLGLAGIAWAQADHATSAVHAQAARAMFAQLGDALQEGSALNTLALTYHGRAEHTRAREIFLEALERYAVATSDPFNRRERYMATTIDNLGSVAHELGDDEEALRRWEEALALNTRRNDVSNVAMNELHLGLLKAEGGREAEACSLLARSLEVYRSLGFLQYAAECLESASVVANRVGKPRDALFLLGAAGRIREQTGNPPVPFLARLREREMALANAALDDQVAADALAEGVRTPPDLAMERTLAILST